MNTHPDFNEWEERNLGHSKNDKILKTIFSTISFKAINSCNRSLSFRPDETEWTYMAEFSHILVDKHYPNLNTLAYY
jgi:hypothetical protein